MYEAKPFPESCIMHYMPRQSFPHCLTIRAGPDMPTPAGCRQRSLGPWSAQGRLGCSEDLNRIDIPCIIAYAISKKLR